MLLTGGLLNSTTVLQPQFLQAQLGYTATVAGLSLSGGGLVLIFLMPMAGQAVGRFPARNIIAFGFIMFSIAYFMSATYINLGLSFATSSWLRVVQVAPIPFVFISITTAAYFGLPREKSNQISGLINFVRNIGGSILISITNAMVTERGLFHQDVLRKYMIPSSGNFQQQVGSLSNYFSTQSGPANAGGLAQGQLYNQLLQQAQALAYVDVFYVLCGASLLMIPASFLLNKNRPGAGSGEIAIH
jgi:DHA2 family multidrug resistance protein